MENANMVEAILNKKMENYNFDANNFKASGEITVTITLKEYRDLVEEVAVKQYKIDEANSKRWETENENTKLKEKLKTLMEDYTKLLGKLGPSGSKEEEG